MFFPLGKHCCSAGTAGAELFLYKGRGREQWRDGSPCSLVLVGCFFFKEIKDNNLNYLPLKQFALFSASYKIVELDRSVSLPVPGAMLLSVFTTWQGNV